MASETFAKRDILFSLRVSAVRRFVSYSWPIAKFELTENAGRFSLPGIFFEKPLAFKKNEVVKVELIKSAYLWKALHFELSVKAPEGTNERFNLIPVSQKNLANLIDLIESCWGIPVERTMRRSALGF